MSADGIAIRSIDDDALVQTIRSAQARLVIAAPGLSDVVAKALVEAWQRLGHEKVSVILDVDPSVCRLGYGTESALKLLSEAAARLGTVLCHQPGLRVAIVITETQTLVYTPTPLLIEAGAKPGNSVGANAICLTGAPPAELAKDLGVGPKGVTERKVGLDSVTRPMMQCLQEDLKKNPPMPFNVARAVNVFNARVEFVEFYVAKIQVERIDIQIPQELTAATSDNLRTLFRFDPGPHLISAKEALEAEKNKVDAEFTRPIRGFGGNLIERSRKPEFEKAVERLRGDVEKFRQLMESEFGRVAEENKQKLHELLLPALVRKPPASWKLPSATPEAVAKRLKSELDKLFEATGRKRIDKIHVSVIYKGVTFEVLSDKEFIRLAQQAFPHLQMIHHEYLAAPNEGSFGAKKKPGI